MPGFPLQAAQQNQLAKDDEKFQKTQKSVDDLADSLGKLRVRNVVTEDTPPSPHTFAPVTTAFQPKLLPTSIAPSPTFTDTSYSAPATSNSTSFDVQSPFLNFASKDLPQNADKQQIAVEWTRSLLPQKQVDENRDGLEAYMASRHNMCEEEDFELVHKRRSGSIEPPNIAGRQRQPRRILSAKAPCSLPLLIPFNNPQPTSYVRVSGSYAPTIISPFNPLGVLLGMRNRPAPTYSNGTTAADLRQDVTAADATAAQILCGLTQSKPADHSDDGTSYADEQSAARAAGVRNPSTDGDENGMDGQEVEKPFLAFLGDSAEAARLQIQRDLDAARQVVQMDENERAAPGLAALFEAAFKGDMGSEDGFGRVGGFAYCQGRG